MEGHIRSGNPEYASFVKDLTERYGCTCADMQCSSVILGHLSAGLVPEVDSLFQRVALKLHPNASREVMGLGSLRAGVLRFSEDLKHFAFRLGGSVNAGPCRPWDDVDKAFQESGRISEVNMAKLHVLQMHSELFRLGIASENHWLTYHADLGVHRFEILPKLFSLVAGHRYLEIGVFDGDCAAHLLQSAPGAEVHLVDPFETVGEEYWDTIPSEKTKYLSYLQSGASNIAVTERFRDNPNVTLWKMTSRRAAQEMVTAGLFDLVFIDGDHSYREILFDLNAWWRWVRPGGIIAVHDYGGDCPGCEYQVSRALHDWLPEGARVHVAPDVLAWVELA
eukprot:gnl/TRDRNA2_/TRDRNA2_156263_c1_seq5.p1 gnl/TRDRNA2_/TRDRNA2_156263_c1~~gnl/TRDRNA2_/TRDRNA2_156263_c1_seq5.p1  ORF type:complete len:344 (+),score=50.74 gnl/TRDRNA2_/TRDRNA2_156263_c1_seq5:27-1034(+)